MPKQFGKGLSLGYAIGIPRHIRSLRMLDCERGWEVSVSGMDMAEFKLTKQTGTYASPACKRLATGARRKMAEVSSAIQSHFYIMNIIVIS